DRPCHRRSNHRVKVGRLHVVHRGVYAVGHGILTTRGRWMAAVLASGSGAVLSHRAAAALWELLHLVGPEVSVPSAGRTRPGILIHHSNLPPDEVTTERRIPVTTVPRTLLDLAAVLGESRLARVVNEAEVRRLTNSLSFAD